MNERIRLLAEQSRAAQYGVGYRRDTYPTNLEELKKFAELIVRECTNIVLHYADVDEGVAVAKKHFGVE